MRNVLTIIAAGLLLASCGEDDENMMDIGISFRGVVGNQDFACGQTYSGMGSTASDLIPADFRLYVHDVELLKNDGSSVDVELTEDGQWQKGRLALLDFEDGSSVCQNGTSERNASVIGRVPEGSYNGVRFKLGVPFAMNHQNAAQAEAPLNLTSMFWNWNGGYKFLRIDAQTTMQSSFRVHLGSTACDGDMMGNVTTCDNPNRPTIELTGFDPLTKTLLADIGALVESSDLNTNTTGTQPGCMSGTTDPECGPLFSKLGLPFDGAPAGQQGLFRFE